MLVLYELVSRYPQLAESESRSMFYYKTKFRNHIKALSCANKKASKLDRRLLRREIGHKLSLKELYLMNWWFSEPNQRAIKKHKSRETRTVWALLADERFQGRQASFWELRPTKITMKEKARGK